MFIIFIYHFKLKLWVGGWVGEWGVLKMRVGIWHYYFTESLLQMGWPGLLSRSLQDDHELKKCQSKSNVCMYVSTSANRTWSGGLRLWFTEATVSWGGSSLNSSISALRKVVQEASARSVFSLSSSLPLDERSGVLVLLVVSVPFSLSTDSYVDVVGVV
jgi:hypothetical protein